MASVIVKSSGKIHVDADRIVNVAVTAAIGAIVGRQEDGRGLNDERMRPYSKSYLAELLREGEATNVDHRRTGTMLNNLRELSRTVVGDVVVARVGVAPVGNRNLIAAYLQRLRKWFGLSPRDRVVITKAIAKARGLFAARPGQKTKTIR